MLWLKLILETVELIDLCRWTQVYHQTVTEDYWFVTTSLCVLSAGDRRILSLTSDSSLFSSGGGVTMGELLVIKRGDATIYTGGSGKLFSLSLGSRSTTRESEMLISGEGESD